MKTQLRFSNYYFKNTCIHVTLLTDRVQREKKYFYFTVTELQRFAAITESCLNSKERENNRIFHKREFVSPYLNNHLISTVLKSLHTLWLYGNFKYTVDYQSALLCSQLGLLKSCFCKVSPLCTFCDPFNLVQRKEYILYFLSE